MVPPGRRSLRRGAARARRLATPVRALRNSSGGVDLSKDLRGQTPAARPQRSKLPPAGGTTDATTGPSRRLPARPCRSVRPRPSSSPSFGADVRSYRSVHSRPGPRRARPASSTSANDPSDARRTPNRGALSSASDRNSGSAERQFSCAAERSADHSRCRQRLRFARALTEPATNVAAHDSGHHVSVTGSEAGAS